MTNRVCHLDGCTMNQTGVCALNHEPDQCPNYIEENVVPQDIGGAVLDAPTSNPTFPPSGALGTEDVSLMLSKRYGRVIGVLGAPDSGKTASLVSMYLLLANNAMPGYSYADSRSLIAFEEIARGSRRWTEGGATDQMTTHTELRDDRSAGLLHLRLRRRSDSKRFDFYVPDLPGEWTNELIDQNVAHRFDFLKSADVVWIMMDGSAFFEPQRRALAVHRTCRLIDRVVALMPMRPPKLLLVVTRLDLGVPEEVKIAPILRRATENGLSIEVCHIASFSDAQAVTPAGKGIEELIDRTFASTPGTISFWPDTPITSEVSRQILHFRRNESE